MYQALSTCKYHYFHFAASFFRVIYQTSILHLFLWHNVILSTVTRISNAICNWAMVSLKFKFFWSSRFYFTVIIYIISNLWYNILLWYHDALKKKLLLFAWQLGFKVKHDEENNLKTVVFFVHHSIVVLKHLREEI